MKTIITDGGRSTSSHKNEKLDCTVIALSVAADCGYDQAHALLTLAGRRPRHRASRVGWKNLYTKVSKSGNCKRSGSVGRFVRDHSTGRFIVFIRGHCFAIIDGLAYDGTARSEREQVKGAWKIA